MLKSSESQQIHISETPFVFNINDLPGHKMEGKEEPQSWSVPEDKLDDLDFSFPLATSLMDSLNSSPPTPFTLEELELLPSTSGQLAKATTLPRRGPMTWPQVRSGILIVCYSQLVQIPLA